MGSLDLDVGESLTLAYTGDRPCSRRHRKARRLARRATNAAGRADELEVALGAAEPRPRRRTSVGGKAGRWAGWGAGRPTLPPARAGRAVPTPARPGIAHPRRWAGPALTARRAATLGPGRWWSRATAGRPRTREWRGARAEGVVHLAPKLRAHGHVDEDRRADDSDGHRDPGHRGDARAQAHGSRRA